MAFPAATRTAHVLYQIRTYTTIFAKFSPLCFNMALRLEKLDNVLRDWAKEKIQKSLVDVLNGKKKKAVSSFRN